jgi:glycosyltransferase involved in cell wall biosynthesis
MRIAFFSVSDQLGGSEIALVDMIAAIRRRRPEWTLHVILPGRGPLLDRAERAGADCVMLPLPSSLARLGEFAATDARHPLAARLSLALRLVPVAASVPGYTRNLRRVLRSLRPSILHTNGIKGHVLGARAGGPSKLVWHMHEYVGDRGFTRSLLKSHERRTAAIIANSSSVAEDVERALAPSARIRVVHNAVDLDAFSPDGPADALDARAGLAPAPAGTIRVGLVGTFARWKGHDVFLRAIAALPRELPVRAYVIGEPLYETVGSQYTIDELRACAVSAGAADRVGFTGFLRAPYAMRALDVVVHASTRPEPFGLVIAEAMACGRAVVTSASGGARELVEPEIDALVHAPGDVGGLAHAIARLVKDAELRGRLGGRARTAACARFHPDRLAAALVEIYEQVA